MLRFTCTKIIQNEYVLFDLGFILFKMNQFINILNNKNMENVIVQRVIEFLNKKKISKKDLAEILGVPNSTLTSKLNGARGLDIDTLLAIVTHFEDLSAEWLLRGKGEMLHLPYKPKTIVENSLERKSSRVDLRELYKLTGPYIDREKESDAETEEQPISRLFYDIVHNMKEMSRNYQEMNKKQQEQIDKLLDIVRTEKSRNDKS